MSQIKAEFYKLFRTKSLWMALFAYVILLLLYVNCDHLLMMVAGDLSDPSLSIGFFRGTLGNGQTASYLDVMRSAHSFTIFTWLICVNFCISVFSAEKKNRTALVYVCHGGHLTVLYGAKFAVVSFLCAVTQLIFTISCLFLAAAQFQYDLTIADVWQTALISAFNILILIAFLSLAVFVLLLTQSRLMSELVMCFLPLAGVFLYQVNFTHFEELPAPLKMLVQMLPTYYWSNFSALRLLSSIEIGAVIYASVTLLLTYGAIRMLLKTREVR